jgi:2-alkyl-3-oxoalkanoate reductase
VLEHEPEAIVHQATALANVKFSRNLDKTLAKTNELRTIGTDALLAAAHEAGVRRFVAQSAAAYGRYARQGGPIKTEDDPVEQNLPTHTHQTAAALDHLERVVTEFGGIALRYGVFYGAANDGTIEPVRKRQFPIVGNGGGIWSWIHLEDAATATVLALEHEGPAIYNVVDDEPAPVREWLPVLAQALGAKRPRRVPTWLGRLVAGEAVVVMSTEARGASNAKAKGELGWAPRHPSWRTGFLATYSASNPCARPAGFASGSLPARPISRSKGVNECPRKNVASKHESQSSPVRAAASELPPRERSPGQEPPSCSPRATKRRSPPWPRKSRSRAAAHSPFGPT